MAKKTVCVLFGGVSSEHEVSLRSAATVLRGISLSRYDVLMVGITRAGRWLLFGGTPDAIEADTWEAEGPVTPAVLSPDREHRGLLVLEEAGIHPLHIDVLFPVLHGKNGEDGTVQGLAELAGIPCVGCGLRGSAVCMDKAMAHDLLRAAGVPKTELVTVRKGDLADLPALEKRLGAALGYPMFIKPANAGSSVGVSKVVDAAELESALQLAFEHDEKVVAEQMVIGQEVECAVMGNTPPIASAVLGEITPPDGIYDYASKYLNDTAGLHIPARIEPEVAQEVREIAVKAYQALDCRGFSRVDFFVKQDGSIVLNEINTIPGFTSISMFPKLFIASGLELPQIVNSLIEYALEAAEQAE